MIKTAVIIILSALVIFVIGFIAGIACAASGAAEHFEEAVLENIRKKGKENEGRKT